MIDFNFSEEEIQKISGFYKKIDDTLINGIKDGLEKRGHVFHDDEAFFNFCNKEMYLAYEQVAGDLLAKRISARFNNSDEEVFSLVLNTVFELGYNIQKPKLSSLRGKLTLESGEEIVKQAKELRDEWDRETDQ